MSDYTFEYAPQSVIDQCGCLRCRCAFLVDLSGVSPGLTLCGNRDCRYQFAITEKSSSVAQPIFPPPSSRVTHHISPHGDHEAWVSFNLGRGYLDQADTANERICFFCEQNFEAYSGNRLARGLAILPYLPWAQLIQSLFGNRHMEINDADETGRVKLQAYACQKCHDNAHFGKLSKITNRRTCTKSDIARVVAEISSHLQ